MSAHKRDWLMAKAIQWESKVQRLYETLADMFRHESEVSEFWRQLAHDESSHLKLLREVESGMSEQERSVAVGEEQEAAALRVEEILAGSLLSQIATLDDAYEVAHRIEVSEVNGLFHLLVADSLPDGEHMENLSSQIDRHLDRLWQFGGKFSAERRKRIHAQQI